MRVPIWAADLANAFWQESGETEPFPRQLRTAIARALPLAVTSLPHLCLDHVRDWLNRMKISLVLNCTDRPLHAILLANEGNGIIFLEGTDSEEEQRFSLAHELAHFLRDYWYPRNRAREKVGENSLAILDGHRPALLEERIHALIGQVSIQIFTHWLERDSFGNPTNFQEKMAEDCADRLAFELLAPAEQFLEIQPFQQLIDRLQFEFGFPPKQASQYAALLIPQKPPTDPVFNQLRIALGEKRGGQP